MKIKKTVFNLLVFAMVVAFAAATSASDWSLYGSARVATFWTSENIGTADAFGRDEVKALRWDFQTDSRIGAKVQSDRISGRFEYGSLDEVSDIRLLYGLWQFSENWGLKVGKDYTPIFFAMSSQVFENDANLWQVGNAYGGREGQISLEGLGFKFAAITPRTDNINAGFIDSETERKMPKLEVSYQFILKDAMSFQVFGGWQYYTLFWTNPNPAGILVQYEKDISSYMVGAGADLGFGPFYVRPQVSWYKDGSAAGWLNTNLGLNRRLPQQVPFVNASGDDIVDIDSLMALLVIGYEPIESLGLEAGIGYLSSESDRDAGVKYENTFLEYYLQAAFTLYPGVFLVPEIGYRDYGDLEETGAADEDLGDLWYAGIKWQIDF
jgi:hypothetical protein